MVPLYEAKMLHLFDTRWATYDADGKERLLTETEKADRLPVLPRYWVSELSLARRVEGIQWSRGWLMGWREVARSTDARTVVATKFGLNAAGHKFQLMFPRVSGDRANFLQAALSSFACDYVARQKLGGTAMSYFVLKQLPVPMVQERVIERIVASSVDRLNGWISDPDVRAQLRAELDGLMFHVYGLGRGEVSHIMETFPIVRRKDEAEFGSYRTKELSMEVYDAMAAAREQGRPYVAPWIKEIVQ